MTATPTPDDGALAACPFCGGTFKARGFGGTGHKEDCFFIVSKRQPVTRTREAIAQHEAECNAAWNTRTGDPATTALLVCNFLAAFNVSPMEFVDEVEGLIRWHMGGSVCQQQLENHNQPMFTLGSKQAHGTFNANYIYREGSAVLEVSGIPLHTTLEELETKPHPAFQAAVAFGKKVVAALNEAEQAGKL